jgi:hypothetical protein
MEPLTLMKSYCQCGDSGCRITLDFAVKEWEKLENSRKIAGSNGGSGNNNDNVNQTEYTKKFDALLTSKGHHHHISNYPSGNGGDYTHNTISGIGHFSREEKKVMEKDVRLYYTVFDYIQSMRKIIQGDIETLKSKKKDSLILGDSVDDDDGSSGTIDDCEQPLNEASNVDNNDSVYHTTEAQSHSQSKYCDVSMTVDENADHHPNAVDADTSHITNNRSNNNNNNTSNNNDYSDDDEDNRDILVHIDNDSIDGVDKDTMCVNNVNSGIVYQQREQQQQNVSNMGENNTILQSPSLSSMDVFTPLSTALLSPLDAPATTTMSTATSPFHDMSEKVSNDLIEQSLRYLIDSWEESRQMEGICNVATRVEPMLDDAQQQQHQQQQQQQQYYYPPPMTERDLEIFFSRPDRAETLMFEPMLVRIAKIDNKTSRQAWRRFCDRDGVIGKGKSDCGFIVDGRGPNNNSRGNNNGVKRKKYTMPLDTSAIVRRTGFDAEAFWHKTDECGRSFNYLMCEWREPPPPPPSFNMFDEDDSMTTSTNNHNNKNSNSIGIVSVPVRKDLLLENPYYFEKFKVFEENFFERLRKRAENASKKKKQKSNASITEIKN